MPNAEQSNPYLMIRLTHQEAKIINEIREKFHISGRQIFEIIQDCGCQEGDIEAFVKASRIKIGDKKQYTVAKRKVVIPRKILSRDKIHRDL
jgi:hypothetical protein